MCHFIRVFIGQNMSISFVDGSLHNFVVLALAETYPSHSLMVRLMKLDAIVIVLLPTHHIPSCSSMKMRKAARIEKQTIFFAAAAADYSQNKQSAYFNSTLFVYYLIVCIDNHASTPPHYSSI
jgi:hypothetical protein